MEMKPRYLGNGVYATYEANRVWIAVNQPENKVVAIDPDVERALVDYIRDVNRERSKTLREHDN